MKGYSIFGKFISTEGERDHLVEILLEAAGAMETLNTCELYLVSISESEPNAVYVYEVWHNEEAHQASLLLEATQNLISRAKPLIMGMERISTLIPMGGKGLNSHY